MDLPDVCLSLELLKSIRTDSDGNFILWAEASNENLDFQGQVVLQDALKKSEGYFLKNGVISYDHRHLHADPEDPAWNPEKYIIGEPLAVQSRGKQTFVKFKLYKSNPLAQELVAKIRDGSTRVKTSIAGKMPQIAREFSQKLGQAVEVVKGVLWDELALTFKPVNQSLQPITSAAFVKSLSATPMPTDSAARTGGPALIVQGGPVPKKKVPRVIGEKENEDEEENSKMDGNDLQKSVGDAVTELEKALRAPLAPRAGKKVEQVPKEVDPDEDLNGEFDDPPGEETAPLANGPGPVKKSLETSLREDGHGGSIDVSGLLGTLVKALDDRLNAIGAQVEQVVGLQKSIGKTVLAQAQLAKSLGEAPAPRAGVVSTAARNFGGPAAAADGITAPMLLQKALRAREQGKIESTDYTKLQMRLNKGMMPDAHVIEFLKSF